MSPCSDLLPTRLIFYPLGWPRFLVENLREIGEVWGRPPPFPISIIEIGGGGE